MKHPFNPPSSSVLATIAGVLCALPSLSHADTTFTLNTTTAADAFVASGSPGNPIGTNLTAGNFGGAGTLAIAPANSLKGEFDSVIKFNFAGAIGQFNSTYGAGNWQITGLTLRLASNFGIQGAQPNTTIFNTINAGSFGIGWLADDSWIEGTGTPGGPAPTGVNLNAIPGLLSAGYDSLGVFNYTPPGNNVYLSYTLPLSASLVADAGTGGDVSLYFYAADNQVSYLFNSRTSAGNQPQFVVSAAAVPEPGTFAISAAAFAVLLTSRRPSRRA